MNTARNSSTNNTIKGSNKISRWTTNRDLNGNANTTSDTDSVASPLARPSPVLQQLHPLYTQGMADICEAHDAMTVHTAGVNHFSPLRVTYTSSAGNALFSTALLLDDVIYLIADTNDDVGDGNAADKNGGVNSAYYNVKNDYYSLIVYEEEEAHHKSCRGMTIPLNQMTI